jgi:hypothetical protein
MIDLAVRLGRSPDIYDTLIAEATGIADRYEALWDTLHAEPTFSFADRYQVEGRIRQLHDLGFAVDEVTLEPAGSADDTVRLRVAVAGRKYHATALHELTALDVGEGQARILLGDLRAHQCRLQHDTGTEVSDALAALRWTDDVFRPGRARAHAAVGRIGDAVQAYCDLLEVRWLLSEEAGHDVGDAVALEALAGRAVPPDSAAKMAVAEATTAQLPALTPELLGELDD